MSDARTDPLSQPSGVTRRPLVPPRSDRIQGDREVLWVSGCLSGFFAITIPVAAIVMTRQSAANLVYAYQHTPWVALGMLAFVVGLFGMSVIGLLRCVFLETVQGRIEAQQVLPPYDDGESSTLLLMVSGKSYQTKRTSLAARLKSGTQVTMKVARLPNIIIELQIDDGPP